MMCVLLEADEVGLQALQVDDTDCVSALEKAGALARVEDQGFAQDFVTMTTPIRIDRSYHVVGGGKAPE